MKTMKKYFFLAAAVAAMVSCSDDTFVGDNSPTNPQENYGGEINFGGKFKAITRGDTYGADAADLLGKQFIVTGVKGDGTGTGQANVFLSYTVKWDDNTAGTTQSNTADWEYAGKDNYFGLASAQAIKFWDYSTTAYDFAAYSVGKGNTLTKKDPDGTSGSSAEPISSATAPTSGVVYATAIDYSKAGTLAYQLRGTGADLAECYITDMITITKPNYGGEVMLPFRALASKVRVAFYETIPGYSVKNVRFYQADDTNINTDLSADDPYANATLFGTDVFNSAGTYTITFPKIGSGTNSDPDHNKAHVTMSPTTVTKASTQSFSTLNYGYGEGTLSSTSGFLATNSGNPTYAGAAGDNYYVKMLPNETGATLELRVNYTLVSTDGSGEEITVHGAKAFVPLVFTQWLPNYAYTYIFKISDNTNGWTSTLATDPTGLYPITFDTYVLDNEEYKQSDITTVATPSITAYQLGRALDADEFATGDIYIQVMNGSSLVTDLNHQTSSKDDKSFFYSLSEAATEAEVIDALNIRTSGEATTIVGRNGLTLTPGTISNTVTSIPRADGNSITVDAGKAAKCTTTSSGTYAYVYDTQTYPYVVFYSAPANWSTIYTAYYTDAACTTQATSTYNSDTKYYRKSSEFQTAVELTTEPTGWPTDYYSDFNCTTAAPATFAAGTYYQKYTVNHKIYGVKVIKIQ